MAQDPHFGLVVIEDRFDASWMEAVDITSCCSSEPNGWCCYGFAPSVRFALAPYCASRA